MPRRTRSVLTRESNAPPPDDSPAAFLRRVFHDGCVVRRQLQASGPVPSQHLPLFRPKRRTDGTDMNRIVRRVM